jgi:signal peptidase II
MPRLMRLGLVVALVCLVADQATKLIVLAVMDPPRRIEVLPFADLVLVWNRGVSFGLFNQDSAALRWILIAVALGISVGLLVWLRRIHRVLPAVAVGLILGGAIGNVVDRFRFGAVVDFVHLYAGDHAWPAFNVADSTITVGVLVLLYDSLFAGRESSK